MMVVDLNECKGCKQCEIQCPLDAVHVVEKKAVVDEGKCVECGICTRVCKFDAIHRPQQATAEAATCSSCPVQCKILPGHTGACKRYTNKDGRLIRNIRPVFVNEKVSPHESMPLMTAVGSGTNYPCIRPAPHIVSELRDGVEVITVVTEAPLSYSGLIIKLDTNTYIGEEGDPVFRDGKQVGMVNTEEYGSKMIAIGGANKLTGTNGFTVARTIVELANGEAVELSVNKKTKILVQEGKAPIINGVKEEKMRIGCGSATVGLYAKKMKEAVDEVIVIDHHVCGLFSEHLAGAEVGMSWSGVVPNAKKSSRGRYFGEHGQGIGGTAIETPRDAIKSVDMNYAKPGMQILVINTTGEIRALFEVLADGEVKEIALTEKAKLLADDIRDNCENSKTSILYSGGTGGSARGGVCSKPIAITRAVHEGKAKLSIGGAPAYVLPGGGINFIVDAGKVVDHAFTWVPTPATVAPVEYTMTRTDYEAIGGHVDRIRPLAELKKEWEENENSDCAG